MHPGATVPTLDPTPVYFSRVKDMEIYASGLFPNLLIEYRSSRSNVVVISSEKLLCEKQKIGALGANAPGLPAPIPHSLWLFKDAFYTMVAKRWQLCQSRGP